MMNADPQPSTDQSMMPLGSTPHNGIQIGFLNESSLPPPPLPLARRELIITRN
jgi:hypothetical protein